MLLRSCGLLDAPVYNISSLRDSGRGRKSAGKGKLISNNHRAAPTAIKILDRNIAEQNVAKKNRILIVEDEPAMVQGLRDNFEYEGYEVISALDGSADLIKP